MKKCFNFHCLYFLYILLNNFLDYLLNTDSVAMSTPLKITSNDNEVFDVSTRRQSSYSASPISTKKTSS